LCGITLLITYTSIVTELMAKKPKIPIPPQIPVGGFSRGNIFKSKDGLGAYLDDPASFPPSRVIYHNEDFVAINDLYAKASIHTLLLPRSAAHSRLHPFEAFVDPVFLEAVKKEVRKLKALVANELQRRYGNESRTEAQRQAVLNGDVEPEGNTLPAGRNWNAEIISGIHAHPSMHHLHVHVLSRDMFSDCLKHRKHYNSFNTPFLIDVEEFPLAEDDPRLHPGRHGFMNKDLVCWRCQRNFKNQFKQLKEHIAIEYAEWKKE
jgi:aprataxin